MILTWFRPSPNIRVFTLRQKALDNTIHFLEDAAMELSHRQRRRGSNRRQGVLPGDIRTETVLTEDVNAARTDLKDASGGSDPLSQLAFIRNTMESASVFTSVPGMGQVVIGMSALVAAYIASNIPFPQESQSWLLVWMFEAILALGIGAFTMHQKATRAGQSLFTGVGKKVMMNLIPALFVGALLTILLHHLDMDTPIPAMWLMLYGTAVISGGAFSVSIVPVMGACFVVWGSLAAFMPVAWIDWTMALGFGGLHIIFGSIIAKRHGG